MISLTFLEEEIESIVYFNQACTAFNVLFLCCPFGDTNSLPCLKPGQHSNKETTPMGKSGK
jgi:hypothetical protein